MLHIKHKFSIKTPLWKTEILVFDFGRLIQFVKLILQEIWALEWLNCFPSWFAKSFLPQEPCVWWPVNDWQSSAELIRHLSANWPKCFGSLELVDRRWFEN